MEVYLYKFMPLLIFVTGSIIFYVFDDYPTLIHVIVTIALITNGLKNIYFANNNIRNHMIWVSPKLDRILGMISGILYFGIYVVGLIKRQPLWIMILTLVSTVDTAVLLETKLYITSLQLEETLSSERTKRKVIPRYKAQRPKCIFFTAIVVVVISMLILSYLKLMVISGLAVATFILAPISVATSEKYFTIIENM